MAIKILNQKSDGGASGESDDIIGQLTTGYGTVPDYVDLNTYAIRSDDPDVAQAVVDALGGTLDEYDGKRSFYAVLPVGQPFPMVVDYLKTEMVLRSRQGKKLRQCDGQIMADDTECACAQNYEHGTQAFREAAKDGISCKPEGLIFFTIPGVDMPGKFIFSKSSESAVRPFVALEETVYEDELKRFTTNVSIKNITSKKTGYSWNVPVFSAPKEA